ncbi:unnamed protein product [Rhizophagus irregularis]|nr:unnamed protein product [Rhizophagus irregularis]
MSSNAVTEKPIEWIEEAINKRHIKYYEYKHFSNIEEIGIGGFGKVYRAKWRNSEQYLALKSFFNLDSATIKELSHELDLHREVHFHDNIINLFGVTKLTSDNEIDRSQNYLLVMEYADGGSLRKYLEKNFSNLTWENKYNLAYQLACAVLCLHDEGIVHRDLHSDDYDVRLAIRIHVGSRESIIPGTPREYSNLYTECWDGEPDNRPSIIDVVKRLKEFSTPQSDMLKIIEEIDIKNSSSHEKSQLIEAFTHAEFYHFT